MSGIYGVLRFDGAPITKDTLTPIAEAMSGWGPDGHGQWTNQFAGLGHILLRVTPESRYERLPASLRVAPHLVITSDARIDNRYELFSALGVGGAGRDQVPDSFLILQAYEKWGSDCVRRLLGDFAFAIVDTRERTLFCARDPFGCKPFVYWYDGKSIVFASDVKGVLASGAPARLNEALIAAHLQMKTHHAEKRCTFFEEIIKLPPAHSLQVTASSARLFGYWSPREAPEVRLARDEDYVEQLQFLFRQSVEKRLRSAFPVGSHLSGGLDSSSVTIAAAQAVRKEGQDLAVFSWTRAPEPGALPDPAGELTRIEAVCRNENLVCQFAPPTRESLSAALCRNPTTEPFVMLMYESNVQEVAVQRGIRVILSGWGGDEAVTLSSGNFFSECVETGQWQELRNGVGNALAKVDGPFRKARRLGGILRAIAVPRLPDYLYSFAAENVFMDYNANGIQPDFARRYRREVEAIWGPVWRTFPDVRATICHRLELGSLSRRTEHWAESGSRHHLEYRYPMLDRPLVEFILGVPPLQLCQPDARRSIFRRAVRGFLPTTCSWQNPKYEWGTFQGVRRLNIAVHSERTEYLMREMPDSPATRFVDLQKCRESLRLAETSKDLIVLGGIGAALRCFAIH